jgi:dCMP deaminase
LPHFRNKDTQFLEFCKKTAEIFSTCAKRQYACILVDDRDRVVGIGYNGGPSGSEHCKDGACPRLQENSPSGSNYDNCISIHAEQNALLNKIGNPYRVYINGQPCFTCAKMIVNSGARFVYYIRDESYAQSGMTNQFMKDHGVECIGFNASSKNKLFSSI